ncbi:MAG: hypothetical protein Q8K02_14140 [Flavobacterium sp.]|nr:hypothetical protein [Flavobacterium sp.]
MKNEVKVNRYIIHFLDKEKNINEAKIDFSNQVSKTDGFSVMLAEEIHKSISGSPSLKNTKFKEKNENDFSNGLNEYLSLDESDDETFILFSKTLDKLKEKIENKPFPTGGFYLFIDYKISNDRYISVVLLRKKGGLNVVKKGDIYVLNNTENINIDKIAMAFRLNIKYYQSSENENDKKNYIALITTQQDGEVSGYFKEWVNAGDLIKSIVNTENLMKIIKAIDIPLDENGLPKFKDLGDFQKAIYDYSKPLKTINILDLSKYLYGEDNINKIADYARDKQYVLDNEFQKNTRKWRGLITIKAKIDGIELNVNYNKINDDEVKVTEDSIIIYSKQLAAKINSQFLNESKHG